MTAPSGCWDCSSNLGALRPALLRQVSHEVHLYCATCVVKHGGDQRRSTTALSDDLPRGWEHTGVTHCTHESGAAVWLWGGDARSDGGREWWCYQRKSGPDVIVSADGMTRCRGDAMRSVLQCLGCGVDLERCVDGMCCRSCTHGARG